MNNKPTIKALIALAWIVAGTATSDARVVISKVKQNEILNTARLLLSDPAGSAEPIKEPLNDPFFMEKVEEEVVEEVVEEAAPIVKAERPLSDGEILGLASKRLKPSGFIDQGGQQYLILNGKKVQDGVSFNFPHQEKLYSILISEIQKNSFTLNLNSESKTISME